MKKLYSISIGILLVFGAVALNSCTSLKNYKYFEDIPNADAVQLETSTYHEPVIKSDDILFIAIQTVDPAASNSINSLNTQTSAAGGFPNTVASSNTVTGNQGSIYGYLVDKQGIVTIPVIGNMHLAGLTTSQARDLIQEKAVRFFKNASVIVRFGNFKVTVLGEVEHPGTFTVTNEKVTVLDALGMAGDMTIYGRRDNVLMLRRQNDGSVLAVRLNFNNSSLVKSPYYYMQQNDELYVEPSKTKVTASDASQARNIAIITSVLTVLVVLLTRVK